MPGPFPGMDPYLEVDGRWPDFHVTFMPFCRRQLLGQLPAGYDARIEERVQLVADGDPDLTRPARGFRPDLAVVRR